MDNLWWFWLLGGSAVGAVLAWATSRYRRQSVVASAEEQADEWISSAQEKLKALEKELNERQEDMREQAFEKFEKDTQKAVARNMELQEKIEDLEEDLKQKFELKEQNRARQEQIYKSRAGRLQGREAAVKTITDQRDQLVEKFRTVLKERSQTSIETVKLEIAETLKVEAERAATKATQDFTEEFEANLEREAKRMLRVVLSRFPRAYCSERGIGNVEFETPEIRDRVLGPERKFLKYLEKLVGVDISVNDDYLNASVLGYDPVRRELGRLTLEKMVRERQPLSEKRIDDLMQTCKKDLFKRIINDGNRISKELRIEGLSEDIRHMMGALRYRYSFAQNQHFHCAEVGWLCGLIASEMSESIKDARRAGMLHDIGKAMDHSKEGGHAVIGAEFIEQHGEAPAIVHAVRAHHFDETPSTDLAYMVIAADAISGARPGARRSTVDSYTQKIADLEKISSSFDGVIGTYILSAGREVRVIVDSERIDDQKALLLSKQIAKKIEDEASYPGQIKLTVVRETQAIEMAK